MKICILSDSHDNRALLKQAVQGAIEKGAEAVVHCGDLVAPSTLSILRGIDIPIHVIHGNNTGDLHTLMKMAEKDTNLIVYHGQDADLSLAERRLFVVHYPHYAEGMATTGKWDIVCCGHSHRALIKPIKTVKNTTTLLINPGTVGAVGNPSTYVIGDLISMTFDLHEIHTDWM